MIKASSAPEKRGQSVANASDLRIAELDLGPNRGRIGITLAPGKVQHNAMTGPVRRSLAADLEAIARWNASAVVTLLEQAEMHALHIPHLGREVARHNMEWHHYPIPDGCAPCAEFHPAWHAISRRLHSLLDRGANVLVHCKGGLGRAGTIAARLLSEIGEAPQDAIARVRAARPGAIETDEQLDWVKAAAPMKTGEPSRTETARKDRALGSLLGLALGDALGTTLEFASRPSHAVVSGIVGGGPFSLRPGQWTDDTAMALALADSLLVAPDLDPKDLMTRFSDWQRDGRYSCTGTCFDIGNTVRQALDRYRRTGDPIAGSEDPSSAGNGALMRLAPVAIRHWQDHERRRHVAVRQTQITHGAREALDASIYLAEVLAELISGSDLLSALRKPAMTLIDRIDRIRNGSWRGRDRQSICADGYVVHSLEAAIWAVCQTTSFDTAVLLAANLGEDADTTAAIAGQIAGSFYGLSSFPDEWLSVLAWRDELLTAGTQLLAPRP